MIVELSSALAARADGRCELCGGEQGLTGFRVSGAPEGVESDVAVICGVCASQLAEGATLDAKHWFCLQEAIWSEVAPVQVLGYRVLQRLQQESWASDLVGQVWLDEERLAWAQADQPAEEEEDENPVRDCNGVLLAAGDSVTLTKDLDPKGANFTAKRGTMVRKIRLTDVEGHILGKVNGVELYIKGIFLKKVS